jgi:hypothetical protein
LRGDHAAARPLSTAVGAGEGNRADDAVAIDDRAPHVEVVAAVLLTARIHERGAQSGMSGKARARAGRGDSGSVVRTVASECCGDAQRRDRREHD